MTAKVEITKEQILAAIEKLPEDEQEMVAYQIRKARSLKKFMELADEIQAEMKPEDELSMAEIQEIVDEVRQERRDRQNKQ